MSEALEHTFRGPGFGEAYNPNDLVDPLIAYLYAMMRREGDRNYPPEFAAGRAYRANPRDVERMRRALARIPRVDPRTYDILFNAESREWVIVKWVRMAQAVGHIPGFGFLYEQVCESWPVYQVDARRRSPESLSERDWAILRSRAITIRGMEVDEEVQDTRAAQKADRDADIIDRELEMLDTYHTAFREVGEDLGVDTLDPEEAARRFGGRPEDWDPDHYWE